jgi:hypothetical protein
MTPDAKVARAQRWKAFYEEDGGIGDMFARLTLDLTQRAAAIEPWETDKLKKIALSFALARELHGMVKGVVADGQLAEHVNERANRLANIPDAKRRFI